MSTVTTLILSGIDKEPGRLLRLQSDMAKETLSASSDHTIATYLAALFKGNGWVTSIHSESNHNHSILLADPRLPETILLIVKFIKSRDEVTYIEARTHLLDFENNLGPVYGCSQFCLIALNGFEEKAERLENFNLLLQDWSYIDDLILHYRTGNIKEPRIQLFAHNKQTYKKVRKLMAKSNSMAVVQATGTGKSYLIARLLQDFTGQKRLVMAPSLYVINQLQQQIHWDKDQIRFLTYARSMNLSQSEIAALQPQMIVLDEFHRCGAEEWGRGVQNIMAAYPGSFKFGTSATPVRYLDNGRDMSIELFNGHVAENLSLAQAIARNILPMPKYVSALYTLSEEISNMRARITGSKKNEETKRKLLLDLDAINIDWERSCGIPHVLKKHLGKNMRKFIIFCKNEEHLNEMEPIVKKWFKEALEGIAIKTYRVHSKEAERDEQLEAFKNDLSKDYLHLLFSIDMLNEGLHVNEVNGVVLLRPTESPNIFYQQIGRCLKVGMNHQPVIFDFVNNFKSIRTQDFLFDLEFARKELLLHRYEDGLDDRCPRFDVNDEVREITQVFNEIKFTLNVWDEMYDRLVAFKKRFGHCRAPRVSDVDKSLYHWLQDQRKRYYYDHLNEEQKEKLRQIGVELDFQPDVDAWKINYRLLEKYFQKNGHSDVSPDENKSLYKWTLKARRSFLHDELSEEKINKLKKLKFNFKPIDEIEWKKYFKMLCEHIDKYGNLVGLKKKNKKLFRWVSNQLNHKRSGVLSVEKFNLLKEKGVFDNLDKEAIWNKNYNKLVQYKIKHGDVKVPEFGPVQEYCVLRKWLDLQRHWHRKNTLREDRFKNLTALGVVFIHFEKEWENKYNQLVEFKKQKGHLNVPKQSPLGIWLHNLRGKFNKGKLDEERIQKLKSIGFIFNPKEAEWEKNFNLLVAYKKERGNIKIPTVTKEFRHLYIWVCNVKRSYRNGTLAKNKFEKLKSLGMIFNSVLDEEWENKYCLLEEYKRKHGDCNVPFTDKNNIFLFRWISTQRKNFCDGTLEKSRIDRLKKLGLNFKPIEEAWEEKFEELKDFISKFGHSDIPRNTSAYITLNNWANNQRENLRKGILKTDKKERLDAIGFEFFPRDYERDWQKSFDELKAFKNNHGHLEVTPRINKKLSLWTWTQRGKKRKATLEKDRIKKLDSIGFLWEISTRQVFETKFLEILKFKKEQGHINFRRTHSLHGYAAHLRKFYRQDRLTKDQIKRLKDLGFDFKI